MKSGPNDKLVIVPESELRRLSWARATAICAIAIASFFAGTHLSRLSTEKRLNDLEARLEETARFQSRVTDKFVTAWEDQRRGLDLVVGWSEYIKDRDDIVRFNRTGDMVSVRKTK